MTQAELLAEQLAGTRDWTLKLIADLDGDEWGFQAVAGIAHALWLCGHLATSQDTLIHTRCLEQPALDEAFRSHFPIGRPVASVAEHEYPSVGSVLATMADLHDKTRRAVAGMSDDLLDKPAFGAGGKAHPHYHDVRSAVSHCCRHEAFHAGQIATIRRLLGKPFLR